MPMFATIAFHAFGLYVVGRSICSRPGMACGAIAMIVISAFLLTNGVFLFGALCMAGWVVLAVAMCTIDEVRALELDDLEGS